MEEFQSRLDALQKESKELIGQCMRSLVAAVREHHVDATRLALAIAQRFSPERAGTAYPVVCLLDAMLLTCGTRTTPPPEQAILAAVLEEIWAVVPPYLGSLAAHKTILERSLRLVRRWGQRGLIDGTLVEKLVDAMSHATDTSDAAGEHGNAAASSAAAQAPNKDGEADTRTAGRTSAAVPGMEQLHSHEVAGFQRVLQSCMNLLEQLPAARAALYCQLITTELPALPSRAALELLCELHTNLRAEMLQDGHASPAAGGDNKASTSAEAHHRDDGGGGDGRGDGTPAEARAALAQLLDKLSGSAGGSAGGASGREGGGGGAIAARDALGGGFALGRQVVRYVSPLFSDVLQRQTLTQRSGFVERLRRRPGTTNNNASASSSGAVEGNNNYYYPRPPTVTRRPFRIPAAKQLRGGAVRRPFPSVQSWIETNDMADLVLYEARDDGEDGGASLLSMAKKRERDGEV